MASLWDSRNKKLFKLIQKPSPNANLITMRLTQSFQVFSQKIFLYFVYFIKKLSLPIRYPGKERLSGSQLLKASMTVEAAIVLPIFLLFLLNIGYVVEIIRLHNNLQVALTVSGEKAALYGSILDGKPVESVLTGVYVREAVVDYLGKSYLEESPLTYGANGLNLLESDMLSDPDYLDVTLTYSVSPFSTIAGFSRFRMANRYYVHRWNGYDVSENTDKAEICFVTESGRVLHLTRDCMHLRLTIRQVLGERIGEERNAGGARYYACERCFDNKQCEILFIAKEGNRYHSKQDCPGLKRTVFAIERYEAEKKGYRICSDCLKREKN